MHVVAVMGSYRKGCAIDTLVDHAIRGVLAARPDAVVDKLTLVDREIRYCRNCRVCRDDDPVKPAASCVIRDDMQAIYPLMVRADAFVFGTPVNMGHETAVMKAFLERCCYVLARPGRFPLKGCPEPRSAKRRRAVSIVSAGVVPPLLGRFCDEATPLFKVFCDSILNARLVGRLYAGAVTARGPGHYAEAAFRLGRKLAAGTRESAGGEGGTA